MKTLKTVKTLYKTASDNELLLLPSMTGDGFTWWSSIYNNDTAEDIDTLFARQYMSFMFYSPLKDIFDDYSDLTALSDFNNAVRTLFIKNRKKYEELYRVEVIPDNEAYALTNNYDIHETYSGTNATQGSAITGQRTDISYDNIGSQNSANQNKVTGYNSSSEQTKDSGTVTNGTRSDTHQFTKGQEQDTSRTAGQDAHTLRRYGNAGVMTVDDIIQKFKNSWLPWSFLQIIFDDICREYLLIGDDCIWH